MSAYSDLILGNAALVAYWRLGESSGDAIDDKSTHDGTVTGATRGVTGAIAGDADTAYSFDGSDVVTIANHAALQLNTGTLEFWFKTTTGDGWIVAKHLAYILGLAGNNIGFFDFGGGTMRNSGVAVTDGLWHHAALVFESGVADQTFIYLDGESVMTTSATFGGQNIGITIGALNAEAPEQFFTGSVDEVALYSAKLDGSTVLAHYNAGLGIFPSGYSRIRSQFELRPY